MDLIKSVCVCVGVLNDGCIETVSSLSLNKNVFLYRAKIRGCLSVILRKSQSAAHSKISILIQA